MESIGKEWTGMEWHGFILFFILKMKVKLLNHKNKFIRQGMEGIGMDRLGAARLGKEWRPELIGALSKIHMFLH